MLRLSSPESYSSNCCHKAAESPEDEMASSWSLFSVRPHFRPDSQGRLRDRDRMRSHQAKRVIIVAIPAMLSNAIPAQKEAPCPLSEVIATAGATGDTDGSAEDVTVAGRGVVVVVPVDADVGRTELV